MKTGMQGYGIILRDSVTERHFIMHEECSKRFQTVLEEAGIRNRFVIMGPNFNADLDCNYAPCQQKLSEKPDIKE